jgi:hypothetical protein
VGHTLTSPDFRFLPFKLRIGVVVRLAIGARAV